MYKLKKLLPIWVLLLSGCTTALDEHQGCSSEPVYIHFTTGSGFNLGVDVDVNTRSGSESHTIGMVGFGTTTDVNQKLSAFTSVDALSEGLQNSPYTMESVAGNAGSYAVTPNEGIDPTFPYTANSAVGIHAYSPYTENINYDESYGWYVDVDVNTDNGQTDWLYYDTLCMRKDYAGNVNLDFRHVLIRLDVVVNSVASDETRSLSRTVIAAEESWSGKCDYIEQKESIMTAPARIVSRSGSDPLEVVIYTNTDGKGKLLLSKGTISGARFGYDRCSLATSVSGQEGVATFYLLPRTSIYKIMVNGTEYLPHRDGVLIDKDQLPTEAGMRREIIINHTNTDNN